MVQNLFVEAISSPQVTWPDGRPLDLFAPIEVSGPLRFGPKSTEPDLVWREEHQLEIFPAPGGLHFVDSREPNKRTLYSPGGRWWRSPLMLRVASSAADTAGWPREMARPPAPWTDETLSVLGDQFLERGSKVGQRFLSRDERDFEWVPLLAGMFPQDLTMVWRRGVLDVLSVRPPIDRDFGRALSRLAVCAPLRTLQLKCTAAVDYAALLEGLIEGGGLPCLEELHVQAVHRRRYAEELRHLPGFAASFPALESFEIVEDRPRRPIHVVG